MTAQRYRNVVRGRACAETRRGVPIAVPPCRIRRLRIAGWLMSRNWVAVIGVLPWLIVGCGDDRPSRAITSSGVAGSAGAASVGTAGAGGDGGGGGASIAGGGAG